MEWQEKSQQNKPVSSVSRLLEANMSVDGTRLLFEGFLQKRKDTLKIRWVTYWFRLQNTTLFFYTKKNGSASHLRGYYYIFRVQSVREIQKSDKKPFHFEIVMTNGKRKILAAETADLRKQWVAHLWQAMQLSNSGLFDVAVEDFNLCDQRDRLNSDSVMEVVPARPMSTFSSSEHIYAEAGGMTSPISLLEKQDSEEATYQNFTPFFTSRNPDVSGDRVKDHQSSSDMRRYEDRKEGLYDVLPSRKSRCEQSFPGTNDVVYDFPLSYRASTEHQDVVYDVPSSLLRRRSDHTEDKEPEEETYWKI